MGRACVVLTCLTHLDVHLRVLGQREHRRPARLLIRRRVAKLAADSRLAKEAEVVDEEGRGRVLLAQTLQLRRKRRQTLEGHHPHGHPKLACALVERAADVRGETALEVARVEAHADEAGGVQRLQLGHCLGHRCRRVGQPHATEKGRVLLQGARHKAVVIHVVGRLDDERAGDTSLACAGNVRLGRRSLLQVGRRRRRPRVGLGAVGPEMDRAIDDAAGRN